MRWSTGRLRHAAARSRVSPSKPPRTTHPIHARSAPRRPTDPDRTRRRRSCHERTIFEQACELAGARGMTGPDRRTIVATHAEWHPGVIGVVCPRPIDRLGRPAVPTGLVDGVAEGSAWPRLGRSSTPRSSRASRRAASIWRPSEVTPPRRIPRSERAILKPSQTPSQTLLQTPCSPTSRRESAAVLVARWSIRSRTPDCSTRPRSRIITSRPRPYVV